MGQKMQVMETQIKNINETTSILPHLDRQMAEMKHYLSNLKGSTEKIIQQQVKTHHNIIIGEILRLEPVKIKPNTKS